MSWTTDKWFHDNVPAYDLDFVPWYRALLFARHATYPAMRGVVPEDLMLSNASHQTAELHIPRRYDWVALDNDIAVPRKVFEDAMAEVRRHDDMAWALHEMDPMRYQAVYGSRSAFTTAPADAADDMAFYASHGFSSAIIGDGTAIVAIGDIVMPLERIPLKTLQPQARHRIIDVGRSLGVGLPLYDTTNSQLLVPYVDGASHRGRYPVYAYSDEDVTTLFAESMQEEPSLVGPHNDEYLGTYLEAWVTLLMPKQEGFMGHRFGNFVGTVSHGGHLSRSLAARISKARCVSNFGERLLPETRMFFWQPEKQEQQEAPQER